MYRMAFKYNREIIFYYDCQGNKFIAKGGSDAWRTNNPGLISIDNTVIKKEDVIGYFETLAIFSSSFAGLQAMLEVLIANRDTEITFKEFSQKQFSHKYEIFLRHVQYYFPINSEKKFNQLTNREIILLTNAIQSFNHGFENHIGEFTSVPKIKAKIVFEKHIEYYLVGEHILTKEEAIEFLMEHRMDAVLVKRKDGKTYFRSRPSHSIHSIEVDRECAKMLEDIREGRMKLENRSIYGLVNESSEKKKYPRKDKAREKS